jgi:predicted peptidase
MRAVLVCSGLALFCWAGCVSQDEKAGCVSQDEKRMESQPALTPGQHGQAFEKTITKTISCQYLLFLPAGYGEDERQWPLILFLHGMGQCGSGPGKSERARHPKDS